MKNLKFLGLAIFSLCFIACNNSECENQNPIFDRESPSSNAYKAALLGEMEILGRDNLSFWVADYQEEAGLEYILVTVSGEKLCAKALVEVSDWQNMQGIKDAQAKGYRGAELEDFDFDVQRQGANIRFVFRSLGHIID